jgi:dihydropyrimidine dehydrogenase (NAD+) subunit PreA
VVKWEDLDLNYHLVAEIDQAKCIECELCWTACEDGAHQAIRRHPRGNGGPVVEIIEEACVGCNLCSQVCPVQGCITMRQVPNDFTATNWKEYSAGKKKLAPRSDHFHTATWVNKA